MATPRSQDTRTWTPADIRENEIRVQRNADQRLWERLGELIGLRGRDFESALGRLIDDRIAHALATKQPTLIHQLTDPDQADAIKGTLGDILCDDIVAMFQILTNQGNEDESSNTRKT